MGYNNGTWSQYEDPRGTANGTELGEGQTNYEQMVGQASINYANSFGLHNVEVLALVEARDNKSHGLSAYAKNLPFIQLPELGSDGGGVLPTPRLADGAQLHAQPAMYSV